MSWCASLAHISLNRNFQFSKDQGCACSMYCKAPTKIHKHIHIHTHTFMNSLQITSVTTTRILCADIKSDAISHHAITLHTKSHIMYKEISLWDECGTKAVHTWILGATYQQINGENGENSSSLVDLKSLKEIINEKVFNSVELKVNLQRGYCLCNSTKY